MAAMLSRHVTHEGVFDALDIQQLRLTIAPTFHRPRSPA